MGLQAGQPRWRVLVVGHDATKRDAEVMVVATMSDAASLLEARPDLVIVAVDPRDPGFAAFEAAATALGIPVFVAYRERRRQAEEELRRIATSLANAQRIARIGNWDFDLATGQVRWSTQVFDMLGYDAPFEPTGEDYMAHVHPDDRARVRHAEQQALNGSPVDLEYRVIPRRGPEIVVRGLGQIHRDEAGRPLRLTGTVQDVTERKAAEAALVRHKTRLRRSLTRLRALSARVDQIREQERARIARDLHDQLGQAFTALKMDVGEVRRRLHAGDVAGVEQRLAEMSAFIDASVLDVRRVAHELRPALLDDLGLVAALQAYLDDVQRRTGLGCTLAVRGDDTAIAPERANALFRVVQEALTNVVRHAAASRAEVSIDTRPETVRVVIQDDGAGLPPRVRRNRSGVGLTMMRDRVELLGGSILVTWRRAGGRRAR